MSYDTCTYWCYYPSKEKKVFAEVNVKEVKGNRKLNSSDPNPCNLGRPFSGQGPPGNVEQETLPQPVVASQQVEAPTEIEMHRRRRTDVGQSQALEHRIE